MTVGILLVGGFGTRLLPLTNKTPKPMLPIANLPVTEHQLLAAKAAGITKVVLATAYLAETFTPYFGDGSKWGIELKYALESEPLGTGGAIRNAAELILSEMSEDEPIVVFNGDVLSRHDLAAQIRFTSKFIGCSLPCTWLALKMLAHMVVCHLMKVAKLLTSWKKWRTQLQIRLMLAVMFLARK